MIAQADYSNTASQQKLANQRSMTAKLSKLTESTNHGSKPVNQHSRNPSMTLQTVNHSSQGLNILSS